MAKIRDLKSTADRKLTKVANDMVKHGKMLRAKDVLPTERKRGRKPLTAAEKEPAAAFIRIAGMRLAKILKLSKALRHCANKDVYSYTDEQTEKIFRLIRNSIDRTEAVFNEAKHATNGAVVRKISKLENPLAS